jgi:hypothetical protein
VLLYPLPHWLGWAVAITSTFIVLRVTLPPAFLKDWLAQKSFAEFLCTSGRIISVRDAALPESLRPSSAIGKIGRNLYWTYELKTRNEWTATDSKNR